MIRGYILLALLVAIELFVVFRWPLMIGPTP